MKQKRTKANIESNKRLKEMFVSMGHPERCEMCGSTFALSFAHKHRRDHYQGEYEVLVETLSDYNEVIIACIKCHMSIEGKQEMTDEVFNRLRPCE